MDQSTVELSKINAVDIGKKVATRVLHVDDDAGFLKTAKQCLEMQGQLHVDIASSVDEAFEKMKKEEYDIVISDYQMCGKDGLQFLEELRKKGSSIPFVIFTGKGREEVVIKALNLGADQYLDKKGDPKTVYCELAHGIQQAVEKRRARIEAWQREERLRSVLACSPDAIVISDLNGDILDCNEAALRLAGYSTKEKLVGKSSFGFIAQKDRERALQSLGKTLRQGMIKSVEYTLLRSDRSTYEGELSVSVLKDPLGNAVGFVGLLRDITARKRAENDLLAARDRLEKYLDSMLDGVVVTDSHGMIVRVNLALCRMQGHKLLGEPIGKPFLGVILRIDEENCKMFGDVIANRRNSITNLEAVCLKKDGTEFPVLLNTSLISGGGKYVGTISVIRDMNEIRLLQQELMKSEKLAYIGQLASCVAHEIRNPLGVIRNSVYFLNLRLKENVDEKIARHLRIIEDKIDSVNDIITGLLDFARKKVPILEPANLNTIVKQALANLSIPENIKTTTNFDEVPEMLLDPGQILRVFLNIIQNAIEAMPEGGKLTVGTLRDRDSVEISFEDSGVGISEENMSKLYSPLFSMKAKGLGLGLTICKQIVETHGGSIIAKSKVGQGTTFTVKLPIQAKTEESLNSLSPPDAQKSAL